MKRRSLASNPDTLKKWQNIAAGKRQNNF